MRIRNLIRCALGVRSVRHEHQGSALALRLRLIWAVPIGGPAAILLYLRRSARIQQLEDEPPSD